MTVAAGARQRFVRRPQRKAGGGTFLASAAIVHVGNYAYNVVMGRALGPALFSDLAVVVTLLLAAALAAGTLQIAAARVAVSAKTAIPMLRRRAALLGIAAAAVLAGSSGPLAAFFRSASPWPYVIFGLGLPAFFAQAVDRGRLQGTTSFGRLALTYQAEMWTRLGGAVLLVAAGLGLNGAVAALSLSFVAGWAVAVPRRSSTPAAGTKPPALTALAGAAAALAVGEVLINHSDLLIVKHVTAPVAAGAYGALAAVGRVPFFIAWSISTIAFPYAARAAGSTAYRLLLGRTLATVGGLGAVVTAIAFGAPQLVVGTLFGSEFGAYADYLGLYAFAATLFAIAHTVATLQLAAGRSRSTVLVLAAGLAQTAALWLFHDTIATVVVVQAAVMALLVAALIATRARP